jgi:hypothetical protein
VSQGVVVVATQSQPAGAVTVTSLLPPATGTAAVSGATAKLHATAHCVMVTGCPATVTVPVRDSAAGFGAAVIVSVPSPEPLPPVSIVNHSASLVAVQAHSSGAVTVTVAVPPSLPIRSV